MAAMGKISLLGTISLQASTTLSGHRGIFAPSVDQFDKLNFTKRWIPPLHVFGDPLLGSGNNVFILNSNARADHPPYGMTYFPHKATGRFTDGRTAADFIAQLSGLPFPPPYLEVKKEGKPTPKTGLNFASAACGIMPDTGNTAKCLNADQQLQLFREAAEELSKHFKNKTEFSQYLFRSLFFISMGSNDYSPGVAVIPEPISKSLQTMAPNLLKNFISKLKKLYAMGARKVLVNNIGAIGCSLGFVKKAKPSTPCVNLFNKAVSKYNGILPAALKRLEAELPGSKFVIMNVFKLAIDIKNSPARFNIYDTTTIYDATTSCYDSDVSGATTCKNMKSHLFFDNVHPTQTVHYLLVRRSSEKLYAMGARKFLVSNIGADVCTSGFVKKAKPSTSCVDLFNEAVSKYNENLKQSFRDQSLSS